MKKLYILLFCGVFILVYLYAFVGFFKDKCGCGYRFYIIPQRFHKLCFVYCEETRPMTTFQITVNRLLGKPIETKYVMYGRKLDPLTFKGADKLKGDIAAAMAWYENKGASVATSFASQQGLITEKGKLKVTILTKGDSSLIYEKEFAKYGIDKNQLSDLNNFAYSELDFETVRELAGEEFVYLLMRPANITLP